MGVTYSIYTPLDPSRVVALEAQFDRVLNEWLEEHPDEVDGCGEVFAGGGPVPSRAEAIAAHEHYSEPISEEMLTRLERCRGCLTIDHPVWDSPLQNAALVWILERTGDAVCILNDYPLVSSDVLLKRLARERRARDFGVPPPEPKKRTVKQRKARPGELRALRAHAVLAEAAEDADTGIDVRQALQRVSEDAQRYAELLLEEGAQADADAGHALGWEAARLTAAADELDHALRRFAPK